MSEDRTFIKLYRAMKNWGWYSDPPTKDVFLHLLLNANWEDGEFRGTKLHKGEVVFGRKKYAQELGLSEQQVRTAIKHLQQTGEISTIKATNKFTVFLIEKWGFYQGCENESTNNLTNEQPTTNQQLTTSKNKRIKEEKNIDIYSEAVSEIVTYLNQRAGKHYRANSASTSKPIRARLKEGYTVEDFRKVIDIKTSKWLGDPKMNDFLRPQTLFGTKFESYLNERMTTGNAFADAVLNGELI